MTDTARRGLFITFEGGDAAGKSTQVKRLKARMVRRHLPVIDTHDPGGTPLSEKIRTLIKWEAGPDTSGIAELLLFGAARAQLIDQVINPWLNDGGIVISDRFSDSTLAYQGFGRGLGQVQVVNDIVNRGLKPDLTILLDVPIIQADDRLKGTKKDRFETEGLSFRQRARDGYLQLAQEDLERWLVLDATQSKNHISAFIWARVDHLIARYSKVEEKNE